VVVEAMPRNFQLPHHYRVSSTRNDRCYGLSSSFGPSRPPHFFKRLKSSSNLLPKIQVSVPRPLFNVSAENLKPPSRR
jgi:hypothetical protein